MAVAVVSLFLILRSQTIHPYVRVSLNENRRIFFYLISFEFRHSRRCTAVVVSHIGLCSVVSADAVVNSNIISPPDGKRAGAPLIRAQPTDKPWNFVGRSGLAVTAVVL